MPISNIIDRRTNEYNVNCDVVFEPSCNDNSVDGATQFDPPPNELRGPGLTVESKYNTTIFDVHRTADKWNFPVTAYIYDRGSKPDG